LVLSKVVITLRDPFEKAWSLLKQQMTLNPYGYTTGLPDISGSKSYASIISSYPSNYADLMYGEFLEQQRKDKTTPQYKINVSSFPMGMDSKLLADESAVGNFPMGMESTEELNELIEHPDGASDVVAHTTVPDWGQGGPANPAGFFPRDAYAPVGSSIAPEHQGKGLYIRSLLSLLSSPSVMGITGQEAEGLNELHGARGLMSVPMRTHGKGGSHRSHELLNEQYKKIMDLPGGPDRHTYGEGQTLTNIIDMAERGEGMFGSHGGKLKHNLMEGSFGELRNPNTMEALLRPAGKTFFYDPIPIDIGKVGDETKTFGDLRRYDLAGLPVRVKEWAKEPRDNTTQTRFTDWG